MKKAISTFFLIVVLSISTFAARDGSKPTIETGPVNLTPGPTMDPGGLAPTSQVDPTGLKRGSGIDPDGFKTKEYYLDILGKYFKIIFFN